MICNGIPPIESDSAGEFYATIVVLAVLMAAGFYVALWAAIGARRGRLVLSRGGEHVLIGRAAVIAAVVVITMACAGNVLFALVIVCNLRAM